MQEIAVRAMQLDRVDAEPVGALRRIDERIAHAREPGGIERQRRQTRRPCAASRTALRSASRLRASGICWPPSHGRVAGALAAGMRELHRDRGFGMLAHRGQDRPECGFGGVVVKPEAARRDAPDRFHMGGLDAEHRRTRQRQRVDMREVPVIGRAIIGRILAHRRHHDAIGQRKIAQADRGKQGAHGGCPDGREVGHVFSGMERIAQPANTLPSSRPAAHDPSSPCGRGRCEDARVRGRASADRDPSSGGMRSATFSHKGRRK